MKNLLVIFFCLIFGTTLFAQKKLRRTYGIEKMTETTVIYKDGNEINRYTSEYEVYNKDGEWIERVDLLPDGRIKRKELRKFKKGEVVERIVDEPTDRSPADRSADYDHEKYEFSKEGLVKKEEFDREGNLLEYTEYDLNKYSDRVEERHFDGDGKLLFTEKLEYDERGFRISKTTYNASEVMVELKIYSYE